MILAVGNRFLPMNSSPSSYPIPSMAAAAASLLPLRRRPSMTESAAATACDPNFISASPNPRSQLHKVSIFPTYSPHILLSGAPLDLGCRETVAGALRRKHPSPESASPAALRRRVISPEAQTLLDYAELHLTGLKPEKLDRLLRLVSGDPQSLEGFQTKVGVLLDSGIPRDHLAGILNAVNLRTFAREISAGDLRETISYLRRFGWPEVALRRPMLLTLGLRNHLIPRVDLLADLAGGDEAAAAVIVRKLPNILSYTVEHLRSHIDFWRSAGFSDDMVFRVAAAYPNVFSVSKEKKLRPRVELLLRWGMSPGEVARLLVRAPTLISLSFKGNLSKKLALLVKIGYRDGTRELAGAVAAAARSSAGNLQGVIGFLLGAGMSCGDVVEMTARHPPVLGYGRASVERKVRFLVEEMGRGVGELLGFPAFLGYDFERRIRRRYEEVRESGGREMSLNALFGVSCDKFYESNGGS